jgi:hypothetical protein
VFARQLCLGGARLDVDLKASRHCVDCATVGQGICHIVMMI